MADVRQIRLWWKRWPAANVGIATGRESGLVVLDFDLRSGGLASHDRLLRDFPGLDETVTVRTGGGGLHLWFAHPGVHVGNRVGGTNARFRGVDVRGDGGLVIAPPSRHRAGVYEFAPGRGLGEVPLAHLPAGLLEAFGFFATNELSRSDSGEAQNHTSKETRPPKQGHVLGTLSAKQNEEIGAAVRQSVPTGPGMRNQQVFVLVRRLKFLSCLEGIDPEELRPVVKEWFDRARATARERGFAIEGGFAETMDDFLYGWPRAKFSMEDTLKSVLDRVRSEIDAGPAGWPEPVRNAAECLGYAEDPATAALMLLCHGLQELWEPKGFPLSARKAVECLDDLGIDVPRDPKTAWRILRRLEGDGVLCQLEKGKPAPQGKGEASIWLWVWEPRASHPAAIRILDSLPAYRK